MSIICEINPFDIYQKIYYLNSLGEVSTLSMVKLPNLAQNLVSILNADSSIDKIVLQGLPLYTEKILQGIREFNTKVNIEIV